MYSRSPSQVFSLITLQSQVSQSQGGMNGVGLGVWVCHWPGSLTLSRPFCLLVFVQMCVSLFVPVPEVGLHSSVISPLAPHL